MQKPAILDASIVGAWLLPDEENEFAELVIRHARDFSFHVPSHWLLEVLSIFRIAEKRGRLNEALTAQIISDAGWLWPAVVYDHGSANGLTLHLSRQYELTVYDAAYLELGLRFGCPILTLDKALKEAAAKAKLPAWNG